MKYDVVSLDSFDTTNMNLIKSREKWYGKDDHSRWVFENDGLYYKIWNETYMRKDRVKFGIENGFYDKETVPAFVGLIYYENICRGYITKKCTECREDITPFYEIIKNKTRETKSFVYDFSEKHTMKFEGEFSLIDLEGIYPLSRYDDIAVDRYNESFSLEKYKEFVYELCKN